MAGKPLIDTNLKEVSLAMLDRFQDIILDF